MGSKSKNAQARFHQMKEFLYIEGNKETTYKWEEILATYTSGKGVNIPNVGMLY